MISSFYLFLEILGTVAFAISGTVVGINHKLDIFGILVMSVITAVGGGIFRDLLLGATPPTALKSPFFIVISIIASIVAMLVALIIKSRREALSIFKAARFYDNTDEKTDHTAVIGEKTTLMPQNKISFSLYS